MNTSVVISELCHVLHYSSASSSGSSFFVAAIEKLRDSGDGSFLFLRSLLDLLMYQKEEDLLLFHCILGVRDTFLQQWEVFPLHFTCLVRDFFFTCGLWGDTSSVISKAFLSTSAAFWKRSLLFLASSSSSSEHHHHELCSTTNSAITLDQQLGFLEQEIIKCQTSMFQNNNNYTKRFPLNKSATHLFMDYMEQVLSYTLQQHNNATNRSNLHASSMVCFFLNALLGEVSVGGSFVANSSTGNTTKACTSNAARYNQPFEFHRNVFNYYSSQEGGLLDFTLKLSTSALLSLTVILQQQQQQQLHPNFIKLAISIASLTTDVLSWDFSTTTATTASSISNPQQQQLPLKLPKRWKHNIITFSKDLITGIFTAYNIIRSQIISSSSSTTTTTTTSSPTALNTRHDDGTFSPNNNNNNNGQQDMILLANSLRQLLVELASISGPIFSNVEEHHIYSEFLVEGCLNIFTTVLLYDTDYTQEWCEGTEAIDICAMVCRLLMNHKIQHQSLSKQQQQPQNSSSNFLDLLHAFFHVGTQLLQQMLSIVEANHGHPNEDGSDSSWREEALDYVLQGAILLVEDPTWFQQQQQQMILPWLSSLYTTFVNCRTKIARMEEHYLCDVDLDEIQEHISEQEMDEQMAMVAIIGRTCLSTALTFLNTMFVNDVFPRLVSFMNNNNDTTIISLAQGAALLEEARLGMVCISYLLTDDSSGETPTIPEAIMRSQDETITSLMTSLVLSCLSLAEFQASRIAILYPNNDPRLSPLLGKTFLFFLIRWAPAYIIPESSSSLNIWNSEESAQQVVSFCVTLCLHYYCFWSQEDQLQESAIKLLHSLVTRRGSRMRRLLTNAPSWEHLVAVHVITTTMVASAAATLMQSNENGTAADADYSSIPKTMVEGYQRLSYIRRAEIFSIIITGCSSSDDESVKVATMLNKSLEAVHSLFTKIATGLGNKSLRSQDVHVRDMVVLAVEMYWGIAQSSEMNNSERIPQYLSPYLADLSGLMLFYADDLTVCYSLLRVFRDYAERFVAMLSRTQCLALLQASAALLKGYSQHHCLRRQVVKHHHATILANFEEEQSFNDVLCAIQLLIHLGTKDFIDTCADVDGCTDSTQLIGVDSSQITDVIFFGLQQIIPLMTHGLLQYPALCTQYFSLVGFMMDTYPEKTCALPYELFRSLLDSLLFGMSHSDPFVSKSSLTGMRGIAVEHLKTGALNTHLGQHGDIFYQCITRLFSEVIFRPIVWDRLEASSLALMPLIAVDGNGIIVSLVNEMVQKLDSVDKQQRFVASFAKLIRPEVINGGYNFRMTRIQFKKDFEAFVKDIHSFLILK